MEHYDSFAFLQGESGGRRNVTPFPSETPPAMAYVPFQETTTMYDPDEGLQRGTVFPILDKPFTGKRGVLE